VGHVPSLLLEYVCHVRSPVTLGLTAADCSEEQFKGYLKEAEPVAHRIVESLEQD
jgi:hypothetical protein